MALERGFAAEAVVAVRTHVALFRVVLGADVVLEALLAHKALAAGGAYEVVVL